LAEGCCAIGEYVWLGLPNGLANLLCGGIGTTGESDLYVAIGFEVPLQGSDRKILAPFSMQTLTSAVETPGATAATIEIQI